MRPTPIGSRPRLELGHQRPTTDWDTWYDLHPLPIDRPPTGTTETTVTCGTCGESLTVAVQSSTEVRMTRRIGLTLAVALVLLALAVAGLELWGLDHGWDSGRTFFVWFIPPLLLFAAHPWYRRWRSDDGTELVNPPNYDHVLREPGHTVDRGADTSGAIEP
jgi:hypothetical protein